MSNSPQLDGKVLLLFAVTNVLVTACLWCATMLFMSALAFSSEALFVKICGCVVGFGILIGWHRAMNHLIDLFKQHYDVQS